MMQLRIFTEPQQGASYDQLLAVARATEANGFDAFFRSDHLMRMGGGDGWPGPTESWVTLGALARETSRIRPGTLVTSATFRLPGPRRRVRASPTRAGTGPWSTARPCPDRPSSPARR
jgi:alkanesulfonate monooxygenase SsuD/methylene tetrahydromethanopterin reductase-like flavin-dependent oxidoreductase (luciferase family)